jgi:hypothetical protein
VLLILDLGRTTSENSLTLWLRLFFCAERLCFAFVQVARSNAEDYSVVVAALRLRILELERGPAVAAAASSSAESSEVRDIAMRCSVAMEARAAHGLWKAFLACRT